MLLHAKKLGKTAYVFSVDAESNKVAHANCVSETAKSKGLDGRAWSSVVVNILGGKVRVFIWTVKAPWRV